MDYPELEKCHSVQAPRLSGHSSYPYRASNVGGIQSAFNMPHTNGYVVSSSMYIVVAELPAVWRNIMTHVVSEYHEPRASKPNKIHRRKRLTRRISHIVSSFNCNQLILLFNNPLQYLSLIRPIFTLNTQCLGQSKCKVSARE